MKLKSAVLPYLSLIIATSLCVADPAAPPTSSLRFVRDGTTEQLPPQLTSELTVDVLEMLRSASHELSEGERGAASWEDRKGNTYLHLSYDRPVKVKVLGEQEADGTDIVLPIPADSLVIANRELETYRAFSKYSGEAMERLVCRPELKLETYHALCTKLVIDQEFLSSAEVAEIINKTCDRSKGAEQYRKCVESVLHNLWEEKKILYTEYDEALRKAWASTEVANTTYDTTPHLFDKYLEQTKLEREIQTAYANIIRARFAQVSAALADGGGNLKTDESEQQHRAYFRKLQLILKDLLAKNPDLPPSPMLHPPYTLESIDSSRPSGFVEVPGVLSDKTSTTSSVVPTPAPVSPTVLERMKQFFRSDREARTKAVYVQDEVEKRRKRIFQITEQMLYDRNLTEAKKKELSSEMTRLQKEIETLVRSVAPPEQR